MKQLYLLLITLLVSFSAYAEKSGTCGDNLQWKLTDEGVLTITGTGEMQDWNRSKPSPWHADKSVKQVIIGNGVTTIGSSAFSDCDSLTSVTIPNSVTTIGSGAFEFCFSLTSVTIPNSVTTIGYYAFELCFSLTSVTIPNSVTTIGSGAFFSCFSLTSVTIPNSVTTIGSSAFAGCFSLTSVTIGNSVTTIGHGAFYGCSSLTSVTIGNSVTEIGYYAFSGCKNVKQITSEAVTPPDCYSYTFKGINTKECKLLVPQNSIDAYKKADGWKEFFLIEGTTTGIINNIYNKTENVDVYTIDGIKRLSKASVNEINALPKGVYIVNGKKIVIK
ncbi:leucine-rich repeat domain-containing protein [Hoylesella nanceiensis]|uniref:leucine-rich repeat domain-containing protein n=1 Tax=Hoylesella nanceiensis TaxID=425941 RepID=UPI0028E8BD8D|nr:leucine-rich repeat domain-containing protein [Hoylesella nanceiensis]